MISVSREDIFSRSYRDKVQTELDCMGFVDYVEYDRTCGFFRTETIRDATPEEVIAWHCLSIWGSCFKTKCFGVTARIRDEKCPKNDGTKNPCPARDEWVKAKELLKDKEVILEVI